VGPERLTAALLAAALVACGPRAPAPPETPRDAAPAAARHVQIIRFAPVASRLALLEQLRRTSGPAWVLGKAGPAIDDIEPLRVFLRRAWRSDAPGAPVPFSHADAEADVIAFVTANADALGLAPSDVVTLDAMSVDAPPDGSHHAVVVRLQGRIAMRGYEAFDALASKIDLVVFVDDDRQIRFFANLSRIHPHLSIDTRPGLDAEDPRLLAHVVGRELFVTEDDPRRRGVPVRELRHASIGRVASTDVTARTLTVHASVGPMGAYVAYHLAYAIDVGRGGYWFRFVVSADTGDLLEDATAPIAGLAAPEPSP
jgi:hypothetical protein